MVKSDSEIIISLRLPRLNLKPIKPAKIILQPLLVVVYLSNTVATFLNVIYLITKYGLHEENDCMLCKRLRKYTVVNVKQCSKS